MISTLFIVQSFPKLFVHFWLTFCENSFRISRQLSLVIKHWPQSSTSLPYRDRLGKLNPSSCPWPCRYVSGSRCRYGSKNRSTEGCSKLKSPETRQVQEILVSTLEHLQVPKWTGPSVRRSKRPLLACRTRCKCSMENWTIFPPLYSLKTVNMTQNPGIWKRPVITYAHLNQVDRVV